MQYDWEKDGDILRRLVCDATNPPIKDRWKTEHPSNMVEFATWGPTSENPAQSAGKLFLAVPLHFFGSKSTISRFGERFRGGQYSLVKFLFCCSVICEKIL